MERCVENCIEFLTGDEIVTVTFSSRKWVNKMKQLAEKFPSQVEIVANNDDGSIVAHIPIECIKIKSPKSEISLSEEQRNNLRERMLKYHAERSN